MEVQNRSFEGTKEEFEVAKDAVRSALRMIDQIVVEAVAHVRRTSEHPIGSVRVTEDAISLVELGGTKEKPRVNLVWMRFPVEPTRSYEAVIEMCLKAKVDGALVTHQGRDLDLRIYDEQGLGDALLRKAN